MVLKRKNFIFISLLFALSANHGLAKNVVKKCIASVSQNMASDTGAEALTGYQKLYFKELETIISSNQLGSKESEKTERFFSELRNYLKDNPSSFDQLAKRVNRLFDDTELQSCEVKCTTEQKQHLSKQLAQMNIELLTKSRQFFSIIKTIGLTAVAAIPTYYATKMIVDVGHQTQLLQLGSENILAPSLITGGATLLVSYGLVRGLRSLYTGAAQGPLAPSVSSLNRWFMKFVTGTSKIPIPLRRFLVNSHYARVSTISEIEAKIRDSQVELYRSTYSEMKNAVKRYMKVRTSIKIHKKSFLVEEAVADLGPAYQKLVASTALWLVRASNLFPELMSQLPSTVEHPDGINPILVSIFNAVFSDLQFIKDSDGADPIKLHLEQALRNQFAKHITEVANSGNIAKIWKHADSTQISINGKTISSVSGTPLTLNVDRDTVLAILLKGLIMPDYSHLENGIDRTPLNLDWLASPSP